MMINLRGFIAVRKKSLDPAAATYADHFEIRNKNKFYHTTSPSGNAPKHHLPRGKIAW
jgi:hypothetical protein